jgi:hypothetical protein
VLLTQVSEWKKVEDKILSDLAAKFFDRRGNGFKVAREFDFTTKTPMMTRIFDKEKSAREYLQKNNLDPDFYLLKDEFDVDVYKPYKPELESGISTPENVIMILGDTKPEEICNLLPRLRPIAREFRTARYYCPEEHKEKIKALLS